MVGRIGGAIDVNEGALWTPPIPILSQNPSRVDPSKRRRPMGIEETRLANRWAGLKREKLGQVFNREKLDGMREKLGSVTSVNVGQTERWASVLGGAALAALALRGGRRSK